LTCNRHWALWKKYNKEPFYSSEYQRDLPASAEWMKQNEALFKYLSEVVLRNLNPLMYAKFLSVRESLPKDLMPLCGAWFGCAINQG
jgi:hypothetical protein